MEEPSKNPSASGDGALSFLEIAERIPHGPGLVLIDRLLHFDEFTIEAMTRSHQRPDHPLAREDGSLPIAAGIEYGGQTIALHLALLGSPSSRTPGIGLLVRARNLRWSRDRLDTLKPPMRLWARRIDFTPPLALYHFELSCPEEKEILQGLLTVFLTPLSQPT